MYTWHRTAQLVFKFERGERWMNGSSGYHRVTGYGTDGHTTGAEFGYLEWFVHSGAVKDLYVESNFRRIGIATALWGEAHRIAAITRGVRAPKHSPQRTDDGDAWARSFGRRLPPRVR